MPPWWAVGAAKRAWGVVVDRSRRVGAALWCHKVRTAGGLLAALVVLGSAGAVAWVQMSASGRVYGVEDVPRAPVAIVLGAGLEADGTPSPYLQARLRDAASLY